MILLGRTAMTKAPVRLGDTPGQALHGHSADMGGAVKPQSVAWEQKSSAMYTGKFAQVSVSLYTAVIWHNMRLDQFQKR